MIIFDLDGTLADCEHRRHYVERPEDYCGLCYDFLMDKSLDKDFDKQCLCGRYPGKWKTDWKAFYEACDLDMPIEPVIEMLLCLYSNDHDIQIWSGRCESVRVKTTEWLQKHIPIWNDELVLKMRPIGDYTPDDQLKERWLDEAIANGETIEMVFDDRPKVVRMWRRRGIFVFDVNQTGNEL